MNYELELDSYQGPLDKLLELVEDEEMDITIVSLAKVTAGFLEYLEELKERDVSYSVLVEFLVVASKLLLIKSKVMIPSLQLDEDDEEDIEDLQLQLRLYKKIKQAKNHIEEGWSEYPRSGKREFLMIKEAFFYPPPEVGVQDLRKALGEVLEEIKKFRPVETIERDMMSLEKQIEELLNILQSRSFKLKPGQNKGSKGELVVMFLAVLHLFKDQIVKVKQDDHFGEIHVEASGNE